MITYTDNGESLSTEAGSIPKDETLHAYQVVLAQVAAGEATIVAETVDLATLKAAACAEAEAMTKRYILKVYSLERQINIIRQGMGYTADDLAAMTLYIDHARSICALAVEQIEAATPETLPGVVALLRQQYGEAVG